MKRLSDFSTGELELWLRDLHAARSSRKMRLERRIKAELESRQVESAARFGISTDPRSIRSADIIAQGLWARGIDTSVRKVGERNG